MRSTHGTVCVDNIFEVDPLRYHFLFGHIPQVASATSFAQLWRGLGSRSAPWGEIEVTLFHLRMSVNGKGGVSAPAEAYICSLEIACGRVHVHRFHVGQIGRGGYREFIAGSMGVAGAFYNSQRHSLSTFEPALAVCHCGKLAECHAVKSRYRQPSHSAGILHVKHRTVNSHAVGVRSVKHHEFFAICGGGIH